MQNESKHQNQTYKVTDEPGQLLNNFPPLFHLIFPHLIPLLSTKAILKGCDWKMHFQ